MSTLSELFGRENLQTVERSPLLVSDAHVGIEIECQTGRSPLNQEALYTFWNNVPEGSIRGYELVLGNPSSGVGTINALNVLESSMPSDRFSDAFAETTSTHVHINCLDMTIPQMLNFIILSIMFEKVLYNYVEPHRNKNHFCLPITDAKDVLKRINTFITSYRARPSAARGHMERLFSQSSCKYAGINLSSLVRYGTLEFRMHHGTCDFDAIVRWLNILLSIREYAVGEGREPTNILETKKEVGISTIFTEVLGTYSNILSYDGVEADILDGIRHAQDIVSAYSIPIGYSPMSELPSDLQVY